MLLGVKRQLCDDFVSARGWLPAAAPARHRLISAMERSRWLQNDLPGAKQGGAFLRSNRRHSVPGRPPQFTTFAFRAAQHVEGNAKLDVVGRIGRHIEG